MRAGGTREALERKAPGQVRPEGRVEERCEETKTLLVLGGSCRAGSLEGFGLEVHPALQALKSILSHVASLSRLSP